MKNRTRLIGVIIIVVIVLTGMSHFEPIVNHEAEAESQELHTIMRLLIQDIHLINEGNFT